MAKFGAPTWKRKSFTFNPDLSEDLTVFEFKDGYFTKFFVWDQKRRNFDRSIWIGGSVDDFDYRAVLAIEDNSLNKEIDRFKAKIEGEKAKKGAEAF